MTLDDRAPYCCLQPDERWPDYSVAAYGGFDIARLRVAEGGQPHYCLNSGVRPTRIGVWSQDIGKPPN